MREKFKAYMQQMSDLEHAIMLLDWDLKTGAPKNAADTHISAITSLSTRNFEMSISDEMGAFLEDVEARPQAYDEISILAAKKLRKDYNMTKNIPTSLYSKFVRLTAESEHAWESAKNNNDFAAFKPYLEEIVVTLKEIAHYRNPNMKPYDVLLDEYEPGVTSDEITEIFKGLREGIVPLVEAIKEKPAIDDSLFIGHFDKRAQEKLAYFILDYMGYNMASGKLSESEHPFTTGTAPYDVRITTNYLLNDARSSLFSVLHEGGHGIYEQNINPAFRGTPLATGTSMGIHESQSRFYENIIGRHKAFWKPIYSKVQEIIPAYQKIDLETFYRGINKVTPSLIRTEADELTYSLHVILRFELEKALFDGSLEVKDLPAAWHDKMKQYLGVVPHTDAEGVLQDTHWAGGAFGYFPSYALGNVYGAQFMRQIEKEQGPLEELLSKGELGLITNWLETNIHQYGASKSPIELIKASCHEGINIQPLLQYFETKYKDLYHL